MRLIVALVMLAASVDVAAAWDGVDTNNNHSIEIGRGQLVRRGRTVEVYDYDRGEYRDYDVDRIRRRGSGVEIEATDPDGDSTTLEMDRHGSLLSDDDE